MKSDTVAKKELVKAKNSFRPAFIIKPHHLTNDWRQLIRTLHQWRGIPVSHIRAALWQNVIKDQQLAAIAGMSVAGIHRKCGGQVHGAGGVVSKGELNRVYLFPTFFNELGGGANFDPDTNGHCYLNSASGTAFIKVDDRLLEFLRRRCERHGYEWMDYPTGPLAKDDV